MIKFQRGFAHFLVILILAFVFITGIGYWMYKNGQMKLTSNEIPVFPTPATKDSLITEINNEMIIGKLGNLEFQLPKNFYITCGVSE